MIKLGAESLDLASQLQKAEKQIQKDIADKKVAVKYSKKSLLNKEKVS